LKTPNMTKTYEPLSDIEMKLLIMFVTMQPDLYIWQIHYGKVLIKYDKSRCVQQI
jgi:hypothetical protein